LELDANDIIIAQLGTGGHDDPLLIVMTSITLLANFLKMEKAQLYVMQLQLSN
jgi:hypothetical protein